MNETLVIGSTVADVIINVSKLPETGEDIVFSSQEVNLGGCAFNVSEILRHFAIPYTLCSPVGNGIYGDFVKKSLCERNIKIFAESKEENGCCYCLVDSNGERSFMCRHGAEYKFDRANFSEIDFSKIDSAYICGLELEESTAENEIEYIEEIFNFHKKNRFKIHFVFRTGTENHVLEGTAYEKNFCLQSGDSFE
ncbi:PfkB family carbohydrate kinase [Treponema zioleckii]|uniref:PfkB family carbohydrate kinase n=1 Tax=Treponema zioleckii TaxID=331680 RepID=UPI00168A7C23|nr:PfkB family carbohydrate kinase [Treponema zioleckii]